MKRVEKVEGTPFTRRRKVSMVTEGSTELLEGLRSLTRTLRDPWEQQRPLISWIDGALEQELASHGPQHQFRPREDAGWYLRQMQIHARIVDDHVAKGSASWAAQHGALFGELWSEFQLKLAREELFLLGAKTAEERSGGGGWNRKATTEQKVASYRKFRAAGHNRTDATYLASQELGVAESNIRAARKAAGASD